MLPASSFDAFGDSCRGGVLVVGSVSIYRVGWCCFMSLFAGALCFSLREGRGGQVLEFGAVYVCCLCCLCLGPCVGICVRVHICVSICRLVVALGGQLTGWRKMGGMFRASWPSASGSLSATKWCRLGVVGGGYGYSFWAFMERGCGGYGVQCALRDGGAFLHFGMHVGGLVGVCAFLYCMISVFSWIICTDIKLWTTRGSSCGSTGWRR